MQVEQAVRSRRTHKVFGPEPVPEPVLTELLELARWAPNHHLTNPWRFRVLGPRSLARLKGAAEAQAAGSAAKLDRAPTLIAVTTRETPGDPVQSEEDLCSTAVAAYLVLLAAHARGYAGYWRTPAVLRDVGGRDALELGAEERALGLLHLGTGRQEPRAPERAPLEAVVLRLG